MNPGVNLTDMNFLAPWNSCRYEVLAISMKLHKIPWNSCHETVSYVLLAPHEICVSKKFISGSMWNLAMKFMSGPEIHVRPRNVRPRNSCQALKFMSGHEIHVRPRNSCQAMKFMSGHEIHVKPQNSCQAMKFMSSHKIHVRPRNTCQTMKFMSCQHMLDRFSSREISWKSVKMTL